MIALHIYWNISCDSIVVLLLIQSPLGDDDRGPSIKGVVDGFIGIDVIVVIDWRWIVLYAVVLLIMCSLPYPSFLVCLFVNIVDFTFNFFALECVMYLWLHRIECFVRVPN